jgi:hypothetical protein
MGEYSFSGGLYNPELAWGADLLFLLGRTRIEG